MKENTQSGKLAWSGQIPDIDNLIRWVHEAQRLWLFLDYDGTIAEFSETPADNRPKPFILQVLNRIVSRPEVRLVIISGRRLEDLQSLIPIQNVFLLGTYGIQVRTPDGKLINRVDLQKTRSLIDRLKPRWNAIIQGKPGFFLEDKGMALAMHALHVQDKEGNKVLAEAQRMYYQMPSTQDFQMYTGHKFLEISPGIARKVDAVPFLLECFPWDKARLLYCGDDDKDAEVFPMVHSVGGINVWVFHFTPAKPPPFTDYVMHSPNETREWLSNIFPN